MGPSLFCLLSVFLRAENNHLGHDAFFFLLQKSQIDIIPRGDRRMSYPRQNL